MRETLFVTVLTTGGKKQHQASRRGVQEECRPVPRTFDSEQSRVDDELAALVPDNVADRSSRRATLLDPFERESLDVAFDREPTTKLHRVDLDTGGKRARLLHLLHRFERLVVRPDQATRLEREDCHSERRKRQDGERILCRGQRERDRCRFRLREMEARSSRCRERKCKRNKTRTFLNSYKPVADLFCHSTFSGFSNGSVGSQYSIMPPTSTEMTVLYFELNCRDHQRQRSELEPRYRFTRLVFSQS